MLQVPVRSRCGLYDATRRGYPAEIVSTIFSTAAIGPGTSLMEIGCGTGQFTRQLAGRALDVTAIDSDPDYSRWSEIDTPNAWQRLGNGEQLPAMGGACPDLTVMARCQDCIDHGPW